MNKWMRPFLQNDPPPAPPVADPTPESTPEPIPDLDDSQTGGEDGEKGDEDDSDDESKTEESGIDLDDGLDGDTQVIEKVETPAETKDVSEETQTKDEQPPPCGS